MTPRLDWVLSLTYAALPCALKLAALGSLILAQGILTKKQICCIVNQTVYCLSGLKNVRTAAADPSQTEK